MSSDNTLFVSYFCTGVKKLYDAQPVLFSMVRDDGQRIPYPPFDKENDYCKCLFCCACYPVCMDGAQIYVGQLFDKKGKGDHGVGRPYDLPGRNSLIATITQPQQSLTPILHLKADGQDDDDDPFGQHEGPCCFGGFLEICWSFQFDVFRYERN